VTPGDEGVHQNIHEELVCIVRVKFFSFECPDRFEEIPGNCKVR
jgi:hypothetical protein